MTVAHSRFGEAEVANLDPVWTALRREAEAATLREPEIATFLYACILNHDTLEAAVFHRVAERLNHADVPAELIRQAFSALLEAEPQIGDVVRADIAAVFDRDPACTRYMEPVLYFKGFHAIVTHRLANWLWRAGRRDLALYLQSRSSGIFQVDIHPAVPLGRGIFLDHATGLVVGSTAVIEDNVSILQDVTLGGTGKERGDRHPKVRSGVLIGAIVDRASWPDVAADLMRLSRWPAVGIAFLRIWAPGPESSSGWPLCSQPPGRNGQVVSMRRGTP